MNYDYIIWDFNGTILDDVETGISSVNKLLCDRDLPQLGSKEEYRRVFRFPIIEYYRALGFDFDKEPYEVIAPLWVEQYLINVQKAEIFSDVRSTISVFANGGVKQVLLSATEKNMLKHQLCDLGLCDSFEEIMGLDNIHAASKEALAREWRQRHLNERVLLIGDTDHDAAVARAIGADCALVCRGHQAKAYLSTLNVKVFDNLLQLTLDI